jgi:uncharacterized DUF497 family protein
MQDSLVELEPSRRFQSTTMSWLRLDPSHSEGFNRLVSQSPVFEFRGRSKGSAAELLSSMTQTGGDKFVEADAKFRGGEPRTFRIAPIDNVLWFCVFTRRGEKIRLISVRHVRPTEKEFYEQG